MFKVLIVLWCGFAFSVGGEAYLGKWKRGLLLLPAFILYNLITSAPPLYYFLQILLSYFVYQLLFYDMAIKNAYSDTYWNRPAGHILIFINGLIITIQLLIAGKSMVTMILVALSFNIICYLSNVPLQAKNPFKNCRALYWECSNGEHINIWNPADSWWLCCWIFGLILGIGLVI